MENLARDWTDKIRRAGRVIQEKREESIRYKKAYTGDFTNNQNAATGKYTVRVNFVYYFIETIMPTIFSGEPKIKIKPKRDPSLAPGAKGLEYLTNYWAKELNAKSEFKDALFDSFFGPAAMYTGWEYETKIKKTLDPLGQEVETEVVTKDRPIIRWLNFFEEVRMDPDTIKSRRARWMAIRVTVPITEFREMQTIKEIYRTGPLAIEPTARPEDLDDRSKAYLNDKKNQVSSAEWVTYWEVWDRERMERKLVHDSVGGDFLNEDISWPYEIDFKDDQFPITILHAKPDPFGPISNSEFKSIDDHIYERVRLRSIMAAIVRRFAPKYLAAKGTGSKDQLNKFQRSEILSINELNNPQGLLLAPTPEMPAAFLQWDNTLQQDLGNVSGLTEFENQRLANTATEASIAEGRSKARKEARNQDFEEFVAIVLGKVAQLCQQLQTRAETFLIYGPESQGGEGMVYSVSKEDIQGEYIFDIIPGSMAADNEELCIRNLQRFYELAMNDPNANRRAIIEEMGDYLGIDTKKLLNSPEDMAAMQKSQGEPSLKFAPIKIEDMNTVDRQRVIEQAKTENQVENLSPGPAQAAGQAFAALNQQGAPANGQPMNATQNMAGNQNPSAPVHPASLESTR